MAQVRTTTLKKRLDEGVNFRLSAQDREFLRDLSCVRIIDAQDAKTHHYQGRKTTPERRLDKLVENGILCKHSLYIPSRGKTIAYTFSNNSVAQLFGGKMPVIGAKRNATHELITSRIYFAEGRPESFKIEADFSKDMKDFFSGRAVIGEDRGCVPDACFMRNGQMVVVESDAGHYNKTQINNKLAAWSGLQQVWGQPVKASARVDMSPTVKVHIF